MKKHYITIAIISILMIGAVIFGFFEVGSPWEVRTRKIDQSRVSDIVTLKSRIDSYYSKNKKLPNSLSSLALNSYESDVTKDPETNKEYKYSKVNQDTYKICATFNTATDKNKDPYSYYGNEFEHPKGNYCFTLKISDYLKKTSTTSKTTKTTQKATEILDEKIESVTSDTRSVGSLSNFPYGFFSDVKLDNGFVSSWNKKTATVTFKFKKAETIKSITNTFGTNFADYCTDNSCYSWSAEGKASDDTVVNIVKTVKTDPGSTGYDIVSKAIINSDKKFKEINVTVNLLEKSGAIYWRTIEFGYE